jgi:hypothetical protein
VGLRIWLPFEIQWELSKFVSSLTILVPLWQQIINRGCSVKLYILQPWVCQRGEIRNHFSLKWTYTIVGDGNLCFASQTMILCYVLCLGSTQQLAANNCCMQQVFSQVDLNWKFPTSPLGAKWAQSYKLGWFLYHLFSLGPTIIHPMKFNVTSLEFQHEIWSITFTFSRHKKLTYYWFLTKSLGF